jgi:hypothetical protein
MYFSFFIVFSMIAPAPGIANFSSVIFIHHFFVIYQK